MDRREFLARILELSGGAVMGSVALSATLLSVTSCNNSGSGGSGVNLGPGQTFTVDTASGHEHDFFIADLTLFAPPAGGITEDTSSTNSHTHSITLTALELADIQAGTPVMGTTGTGLGHTHTFTF